MGKRVALVIGIDYYKHYRMIEHNCCSNSANEVFKILTEPNLGGCDKKCSKFISIRENDTCNKNELVDIFEEIISNMKLTDQLIFYYSGHGEILKGKLYLVLPESKKEDVWKTGYKFENIYDDLNINNISKAIFIVDACHSGGISDSFSKLSDKDYPNLPKGFGFLAACAKSDYANFSEQFERTYFTYYLCKGINTGCNNNSIQHITLSMLRQYINEKIQNNHIYLTQEAESSAINVTGDEIWVSLNPKFHDISRTLNYYEDFFSTKKPIVLYYGNSQNDMDVKLEELRRSIFDESGKHIHIDLSLFQESKDVVIDFIKELIDKFEHNDTRDICSESKIYLEKAKNEADKWLTSIDYHESEFSSKDTHSPSSDYYMEYVINPFLDSLNSKFLKDQSKPFIFIFSHFEKTPPSLQHVMERSMLLKMSFLENIKCVLFYIGNKPPSWFTHDIKYYVYSNSLFAKEHDKLSNFKNPYSALYISDFSNGIFFGRDKFVNKIIDCLNNHNNSFIIYGQNKIGKTSFINYFKHLIDKAKIDEYINFITVYLNISELAKENKIQINWLLWLFAHKLYKALSEGQKLNFTPPNPKDFIEYPKPQFGILFLNELLKNAPPEKKIVLFIDEFHLVRNLHDQLDDFISLLSDKILSSEKFIVVISGSNEIIKIQNKLPDYFDKISKEKLKLLNIKNIKKLIVEPVKNIIDYNVDSIEFIIYLSGNHPYIAQIICYELVETCKDRGLHIISLETINLSLPKIQNRLSNYFQVLWNSCNRYQQDVLYRIVKYTSDYKKVVDRTYLNEITDIEDILRSLVNESIISSVKYPTINSALFYWWLKENNLFGPSTLNDQCLLNIRIDYKNISNTDEGQMLEYKSSARWDYNKNEKNEFLINGVIKTIAAFLNSSGGKLIIGVDDKGKVLGLENDYSTVKKKNRDGYFLFLTNIISTRIGKVFNQYIQIDFCKEDDKEICIIEIKPSKQPAFVTEENNRKTFYVRTGNSTRHFDGQDLLEYIKSHWKE